MRPRNCGSQCAGSESAEATESACFPCQATKLGAHSVSTLSNLLAPNPFLSRDAWSMRVVSAQSRGLNANASSAL
jgi:hypothetical protein